MATVAVYNLKGGVGKTSVAVNLAWAGATLGGHRTLLWDLDGQASASWILAPDHVATEGADAGAVLACDIPPSDLILPTGFERLDLLPADASLHGLDHIFAQIDRERRLRQLLDTLNDSYDLIVLDCPPGLGATSSQVIRAASTILLPMIPSPLSNRALVELQTHLSRGGEELPPIVPVFTMVDMRRAAHRAAIENGPGYPVIPMASAIEMMGERNAPIGVYAPRSAAAQAFDSLWYAVSPHLTVA
ncbi:ParA family protein [Sphingomonas solaris]|uniref:ParA family protein n=1 Tax=Alterirhizorhabdus solaris TaxID=2529389 RepID=A0A558QWB5_9SPHN|nr:ParA family protein [Sphingomonas solaris]TVV71362.1 ParA family protein [Sphingomonas solaris]